MIQKRVMFTLDVVTKNLTVAFSSTLSESLITHKFKKNQFQSNQKMQMNTPFHLFHVQTCWYKVVGRVWFESVVCVLGVVVVAVRQEVPITIPGAWLYNSAMWLCYFSVCWFTNKRRKSRARRGRVCIYIGPVLGWPLPIFLPLND